MTDTEKDATFTVRATPEAVPDPVKVEPVASTGSVGDDVTLKIAHPFYATHFHFEGEDGSKLSVDRLGVDVPTSVRDAIIKAAAQHGITITEVSK